MKSRDAMKPLSPGSGTRLSGREIISDRQDSGLSAPIQNFPFSDGWREKPLLSMTEAEIDCWFDEVEMLVMYDGVAH